MMDSAGLVHSRDAMRAAAGQLDAVEHRGVRPVLRLGEVHRDVVAADQAVDGHVALVVMQGGDQPRQQGGGIQHRAAEHARVHGMLQDLDFDGSVDQAAEAGGQGRNAHLPVAGVRHDNHVGAEQLRWVSRKVRNVGEPASSSPSKKKVTPSPNSSPSTGVTAA